MGELALQNQAQTNALIPKSIAEAVQLAETMAKATLMPDHLRGKPGDCLLVVMQAQRWGMDALSVALCTSVAQGKLCYEGKLIAAVLYSMGAIEGRLSYTFSGSGSERGVTVTARGRGAHTDEAISGTVAKWATENSHWEKDPDSMLIYRGTRQWARLYAPEALLGVYTKDELEDSAAKTARTPSSMERAEGPAAYPPNDFAANLPRWHQVIASGKKTADDLIAMVESKGKLTESQRAAIRGQNARDDAAVIDGEVESKGDAA